MKTFALLLTLPLLVTASAVNAANLAVQPRIETQPRMERTGGLRIGGAPDEDADASGAEKQWDEDDTPVSFTGTWKTIAGGTHRYTVVLKQISTKVTGSYSPGNGKIFDGVVTDNKLAFKWTQDGGYEGTAEFTMNEDGKGFTGSSTALKPKEFTVTWNTAYKPPVISFAGDWNVVRNGKSNLITLEQTGDQVTGDYRMGKDSASFKEATVIGKTLRFKLTVLGRDAGTGEFVMDEAGKSFKGNIGGVAVTGALIQVQNQ